MLIRRFCLDSSFSPAADCSGFSFCLNLTVGHIIKCLNLPEAVIVKYKNLPETVLVKCLNLTKIVLVKCLNLTKIVLYSHKNFTFRAEFSGECARNAEQRVSNKDAMADAAPA